MDTLKSRLNYFNIAFFAIWLWIWWFTIATQKIEEAFELTTNFWSYLTYFTLWLFIIILLWYISKFYLNFQEVKNDYFHPVKSNFFSWAGKILLILSIAFLETNPDIALYFWIVWSLIQWVFTIIILRRWILKEIDINIMNPLWFLPIVWNLLIPIAWVELGFPEISWFFFSIGIIMWIVLFTIVIYRIIFHNPLPEKFYPTLFILIAPPAIALISYSALNGQEFNQFWKILYYFALFLFIILASISNILSRINFYMSWWAYSFPIAAFTISTILFYQQTSIEFFKYLSIFLYVLLIIIIIILVYKTCKAAKNHQLCIQE